jgi:glycosyltransferase involved in cell wall biosynthesis
LLVNKFFYLKGGDAKVFFDTAALLKQNGHMPVFFSMQHPENFSSEFSPYFISNIDFGGANKIGQLKAFSRIIYSVEAKRKIKRLVEQERPDIAHLHNIYHQISPSILDVLDEHSIPSVMTLHDYKLTCPAYTLLSMGSVCEECRDGKYYKVAQHKCTKQSFLKSSLSAIEMYIHHYLLHVYNKVKVFISPSAFLKSKIWEMGFRGEVVHLPNFIDSTRFTPAFNNDGRTFIYLGRLSVEKGLLTLLKAAGELKGRFNLKIIGDGPLREDLVAYARDNKLSNVEFLGYLHADAIKKEVSKAVFTVVPSEWYENNPMSIIESFALGKPVIGARIGGIPELVKDQETGLTFEPGSCSDLADKISQLIQNQKLVFDMGQNARLHVEQRLNPQVHYQVLMEIYRRAQQRTQEKSKTTA